MGGGGEEAPRLGLSKVYIWVGVRLGLYTGFCFVLFFMFFISRSLQPISHGRRFVEICTAQAGFTLCVKRATLLAA